MGGFECSTHRRSDGVRLDLISATRHDRFAFEDYERLKNIGMQTVREGIRWHLIEKEPRNYDFSSVLPVLRAAQEYDVQIIWDICHYGFPDDIDIFSPAFVDRFARFTKAFAEFLYNESDETPFICPVNEISFFSYASGEKGFFHPFEQQRGIELKKQLIRAAIEGIEAFWTVNEDARIVHTDPVINVLANPVRVNDEQTAEYYRLSQYQAWDGLSGRIWGELGGEEKYLDIIGVNYYPHNQWMLASDDPTEPGIMIERLSPLYRPFRELLQETYERYRRPMFIAETGIEDDERPHWFCYVAAETSAAIESGIPVEGICLYPIVNHPGWIDERHCHNGLWDYADEDGRREIHRPLAEEIKRCQEKMELKVNEAYA